MTATATGSGASPASAAIGGEVPVKRIVPLSSNRAAPSQALRSDRARLRVAVAAAMPAQRSTMAPLRLSNTQAIVPCASGFHALRPSPRSRAEAGMAGARPNAPRGACTPPLLPPTASAPEYMGSLAATRVSTTMRWGRPRRSSQPMAIDSALAPTMASGSTRRSTR